jgi:hypothetical protein
MKIDTRPADVATLSGAKETTQFTIKASAKAFHIMSASLYSNKIRAIVRELGTNARDSHVEAGKAHVPFEVHLPTMLEPWFAVKDTGLGMTHSQAMKTYTTFFDSTKTDSDALNGCLGLGSKSPHAYTTSFSMTAIKDGRKGVYSSFIDDSGIPAFALLYEEETSEENGVEVKFAVEKNQDMVYFRTESESVYSYFDVPPVTNISTFRVTPRDYSYSRKDIAPGCHLLKMHQGQSVAVMGNVAYPIEYLQIKNLSDSTINMIRRYSFELEFDIGEVTFQPSREHLEYTAKTCSAISDKLALIEKAIGAEIKSIAQKTKNRWARAISIISLPALYEKEVKNWIANHPYDLLEEKFSSVRLKEIDVTNSRLKRYNVAIAGYNASANNGKSVVKKAGDGWSQMPKCVLPSYAKIGVSPQTEFVISDGKRKTLTKIKQHYTTQRNTKWVYVISPANPKRKMRLKSFFRHIHSPDASMILDANDMAPVVAAQTKKPIQVLRTATTGGHYRTYTWKQAGSSTDFPNNATYYYIKLNGSGIDDSTIWFDERGSDSHCFIHLIDGLPLFPDIYGIRRGGFKDIENQSNWVDVETKLTEFFKELSVAHLAAYIIHQNNQPISHGILAMIAPKVPTLARILNLPTNQATRYYEASKIYAPKKLKRATQFVQQLVDAIDAKYPLLKHINSTVDTDALMQYTKLVNQQENK